MNIGIIGGTFNPIHQGHLKMAEIALLEMNLDKVFFLPAKIPPWKENDELVSAKHRLAMIRLTIKENPKLGILYEEINASSEETNYTIDTIQKIKSKYNKFKINFIIGSDQLSNLSKWKRIDELSRLVQFVAIKRPGYELDKINIQKYNVIILASSSVGQSSTEVRVKYRLASSEIAEYIFKHRLYIEERIKSYMSEFRYNHTINVKNRAIEYAINNKISTKKPIIAALLHDICKDLVDFKLKSIILENYPFAANYPKEVYHQYAAEYISRTDFNIKDRAVLLAIRKHTTGDGKMSKLDKILYCADKTEPSRSYDGLTELVDKCNNNIDEGFIEVLKSIKKYYQENKIDNLESTKDMYRNYLKEK